MSTWSSKFQSLKYLMSHKESLEAKKQMLMFTLTNRQLHGWSHGFQWLNQPKQNEWTSRRLSDMCSNLINLKVQTFFNQRTHMKLDYLLCKS